MWHYLCEMVFKKNEKLIFHFNSLQKQRAARYEEAAAINLFQKQSGPKVPLSSSTDI